MGLNYYSLSQKTVNIQGFIIQIAGNEHTAFLSARSGKNYFTTLVSNRVYAVCVFACLYLSEPCEVFKRKCYNVVIKSNNAAKRT